MATDGNSSIQLPVDAMVSALQTPSRNPKELAAAGHDEAIAAAVRFKTGTSDNLDTTTIDDTIASVASLSVDSAKLVIVSPSSTKPQDFPLFSSLPAELRFKVWRRALPLFARIIRIGGPCASGIPKFEVRDGTSFLEDVGVKCNDVAVLISVNRESRKELLKHYTTPFVTENLKHISCQDNNVERSASHLRVNLDLDVIFITDFRGLSRVTQYPFAHLFRSLFGVDEGRVRKGIKFLAASQTIWRDLEFIEKVTNEPVFPGVVTNNTQNPPYKVLQEFGQLKQISIVTGILKERYSLIDFKDVDADADPRVAERKATLEKRLKEMEGSEECIVKVVELQQKYLAHKGLLATIKSQVAALKAKRSRC